MKRELDYLLKEAKREEKYFKNYKFWARKIKRAAKEILGDVKVFVFGSILKKGEVPRDIDVLIISPKLEGAEKKSEFRLKLQKKFGFSSPFEFHLITPKEYKNWYKYFIGKKIKI